MKRKMAILVSPGSGKSYSVQGFYDEVLIIAKTPDDELPLLMGTLKTSIGRDVYEIRIKNISKRSGHASH